MRLNKFLSSSGVSSRRKADDIILSGQVHVNGKIVLAPYFDVDENNDAVLLNGKKIFLSEPVYYVMNKPRGYVCAVSDKYDPVIVDLLQEKARIFPVGRLDRESEGLIILTNDGNFAQNIIHPSKQILKEYEALLNLPINYKQLLRWREGFEIDGRKVKPLKVEIMNNDEMPNQWLKIVISEGIKREIRLMAREIGFKVERLIRRKIGKMTLQNLSSGEYDKLSFSSLYTKIFKGGTV